MDGAEVFSTSDTVDNTVPDGSNAWKGFGKFYNDSLYFDGKLDQVRIYNTKINQAAVTQLYNETQASASTLNFPTGLGCLALYEFNDDATSTSSSAYNGSPSNITFDSFLFKPDLSIIRNMDSGDPWGWFDTQRGVLERIQSSSNAA